MPLVRASELAAQAGVTPGRISQCVTEGKLEGCYTGEGRDRRFDLDQALRALDRQLDPAQALGNGAAASATRRASLDALASGTLAAAAPPPPAPHVPAPSADEPDDLARLTRLKVEAAELENAKRRRAAAVEEGRYTLTAEVARHQRAAAARLIDAAEKHLMAEIRRIAEAAGLDTRAELATARANWRAFRARREQAERGGADAATHSPAEAAEIAA